MINFCCNMLIETNQSTQKWFIRKWIDFFPALLPQQPQEKIKLKAGVYLFVTRFTQTYIHNVGFAP